MRHSSVQPAEKRQGRNARNQKHFTQLAELQNIELRRQSNQTEMSRH